MSNPTSNFNWQMPTNTDLVSQLPADFEVFGQAVDTSLADLQGGTIGQVLSKATNANMDFAWVSPTAGDIEGVSVTSPLTGGGTSGTVTVGIQSATTAQSGAVQLSDSTSTTSSVLAATPTAVKSAYDLANAAIPKSTVTTNGDLIYATGSGAVTRRAIGSTGQVLTVSGGVPTWAAVSAGSWTLAASGALSGASVTVSSLSGKQYYIYLEGWSSNSASSVQLRFNGDTGSNYRRGDSSSAETSIFMNGINDQPAGATLSNGAFMDMANTAMSRKPVQNVNGALSVNGSLGGWYVSTSAITSVTMFPNAGNWDAGTYYIWSFA